ncbi:MAG TPA: hypothetical protein DEF88_03760, partial [Porphyromonadaceae bacterium]|nr:hypothetical protein [Porphyromonadaceae bacterium]
MCKIKTEIVRPTTGKLLVGAKNSTQACKKNVEIINIKLMSDHKENFFVDFPPTSTDEWMEKITADLKGADFQKKLVW